MEPQGSGRLSIMLTWIFLFSLPSVCTGMDSTKTTLTLESSVFVAFSGKNISIKSSLMIPANQSEGDLRCYSPSKQEIYHTKIPINLGPPKTIIQIIQLRNLSSSGTYYCQYKEEVKVSWFLHVREKGYSKAVMKDYTELITVAVFTGVLLLFSVFGSVYVCRGTWKEKITESSDKNRKQKQNKEDRRKTEIEEENMDMTAAQSTSFYASLQPRPRSIYDVLDHSAANTESGQREAKSMKNEPVKMKDQSAEHQEEVVFESVYENF